MKDANPELFGAIDAIAKNSEEIINALGEIVAALKEINTSQKVGNGVLREINSNLSHLRR